MFEFYDTAQFGGFTALTLLKTRHTDRLECDTAQKLAHLEASVTQVPSIDKLSHLRLPHDSFP